MGAFRTITAVLIDRDGTIIDWWPTLRNYCKSYADAGNIELRVDDMSNDEVIGFIRGLDHEVRNNLPRMFMDSAVLVEKADKSLSFLKSLDIRMILTSAWTGTKATENLMKRLGLSQAFEGIVTRDDIPDESLAEIDDPDLRNLRLKELVYKRALRILNSDKSSIAVVGDSVFDLRAARSLGLKIIIVRTGVWEMEKESILREGPDLIVDSFGELPSLFTREPR